MNLVSLKNQLVLFSILWILDLWSTILALHKGLVEVNPLMKALLQNFGLTTLALAKIVVLILCVLLLVYAENKARQDVGLIRDVLLGFNIFIASIILINFLQIFMVTGGV